MKKMPYTAGKLSVLWAAVACLLLVFCRVPAYADENTVSCYINDLNGILTSDEDLELESKAADISDRYGCGVYVLTIDDSIQGSDDIFDFAEWFYTSYNLGEGDDNSGVLLVLNAGSRESATYFYGEKADYAFDSYGQEKLEDYFLPEFHEDEWKKGMEGFVTGCGEFLEKAEQGDPVRRDPTGRIVLCVGVSCLLSLIICMALRSRMKSVHIGTGAVNYVVGGIQLSEQYDRHTHTTRTRTKIERDSGSGTSSSARSGSSGGSGRSQKF